MSKTILDHFRSTSDEYISAPCNGNHTCGKCLVKVSPKLEISTNDENLINSSLLAEGYRLACDHPYSTDLEIVLPRKTEMEITTITEQIMPVHRKGTGLWGFAIDIGTTTVVVRMIRDHEKEESYVRSFFNPQIRFGADVISRIKASDDGYFDQIRNDLLNPLQRNILGLIQEHHLHENELGSIVITGNTTMLYFIMGKNPTQLGRVPFHTEPFESYEQPVIRIFPLLTMFHSPLYITPYSSAFIGGDVLSGMISCAMDRSSGISMLIDLGTNGEMVIGNKDRFFSLSTAAGPAFEGSNLTCGMPSVPGAIIKTRIGPNKTQLTTIQNLPPTGICGTGIVSTIAELVRKNIIDETGYLDIEDGVYFLNEDRTIFITQKDIREFQLSKAAIQTGIKVLIQASSVLEENLINVYFSGGFGSNIDIDDLVTLGVIPEFLKPKIRVMQNTSLAGATVLLLSQDMERFIALEDKITNMNLAEQHRFQDHFVDCLMFSQQFSNDLNT